MNEQRTVFFRGLRIIRGYVATHPVPFTLAVTGAAVHAGLFESGLGNTRAG